VIAAASLFSFQVNSANHHTRKIRTLFFVENSFLNTIRSHRVEKAGARVVEGRNPNMIRLQSH